MAIDVDSTERVHVSSVPPPPYGIVRDARGVLTCNGRRIESLLEDARVGTPAYLYDLDAVATSARMIAQALGRGLCCYAIKANGAAPIVSRILMEGCGIDVVSGGELRVALACGADPSRIVYSGVAKRDDEIDLALATGLKGIHVESVEEIERIAARAREAKKSAPIAIRLNPDIEADTHAHIATGHDEAKFGIARNDLPRALDAVRALRELRLVGMSVHVGSQLMTPDPYLEGVRVLADVVTAVRAKGFPLEYVDPGGGWAIAYRDDQKPKPPATFVHAALAELHARRLGDLQLVVEPGRALVGAHGVLVTRVIQTKRSHGDRRWLLIDAGMNDLIRPALYQAHHRVEPLVLDAKETVVTWRVAGPVCESSDDFGTHAFPDPPPSMVVVRDAGAYGRSMASQYNARPIAAEVFVSGGEVVAVRRAKSIDDVVSDELGAVAAGALIAEADDHVKPR
jgi:diaminopimelate decarboxylase